MDHVHDDNSPFTEAKLHEKHVILYENKLYIQKALQERLLKMTPLLSMLSWIFMPS